MDVTQKKGRTRFTYNFLLLLAARLCLPYEAAWLLGG